MMKPPNTQVTMQSIVRRAPKAIRLNSEPLRFDEPIQVYERESTLQNTSTELHTPIIKESCYKSEHDKMATKSNMPQLRRYNVPL